MLYVYSPCEDTDMIANMCSSAIIPGQMYEKPKKKKKSKHFSKPW